jgi:hypothetical protein
MLFGTLLISPTLMVAAALDLPVQSVTRLADRSSSVDLTVERVALLGDEADATVGPNFTFDVAPDGRWLLSPVTREFEMLTFSSNGEFQGAVGRRGQGPGEYRWVRHVVAGDVLVHIFDTENARWTALSPRDWQPVRMSSFVGDPSDVVVFGDSVAVVAATISTSEAIGFPIHLMGRLEGIQRSFGAEPDAPFRADRGILARRRLARADSNSVWVAHQSRYRIERWNLDGELEAVLERDVQWFEPHADPLLPSPDKLPAPLLTDVAFDPDTELLWVAISVGDPEWRRALVTGPEREGSGYEIGEWDGYHDTIVEVIDPERGEVIASTRIDQRLWSLDGRMFGASYFEEDGVYPRIEVWRFTLDVQPLLDEIEGVSTDPIGFTCSAS